MTSLASLPDHWQATATLIVVCVHALVSAGRFIAAHGGICGIWAALMHGSNKQP